MHRQYNVDWTTTSNAPLRRPAKTTLLPMPSWGIIEVAMKNANWKTATITLLMALAPLAYAADHREPALSAAQTAAVSTKIATLKSSADRSAAQGWSNAKKVAELICRPAALPVLRKQARGADRVFLGTDAPQSLSLESNRRLTGSGEVRTPQGWHDFTFTCELNPATGKVTAFQTVPK
jgi:hypothetical protein